MDMPLILMKIYLLAGLVFHKAFWQYMQGRQADTNKVNVDLDAKQKLVKLVKLAILAAILIQTAVPFDVFPISADPAGLRIAGLVIFTLGLATAILGRYQLGANWSDIEEGKIASRHQVVSHGIYGYIRHPIYTGDILLLLGLELALNSWLVLGLVLLVPVVVMQTLKEEKKLMHMLQDYDKYAERTKRFIPFVV